MATGEVNIHLTNREIENLKMSGTKQDSNLEPDGIGGLTQREPDTNSQREPTNIRDNLAERIWEFEINDNHPSIATFYGQDLNLARETLRHSIQNIRRIIPFFDEWDVDTMNMEQLREAFFEIHIVRDHMREEEELDYEDEFQIELHSKDKLSYQVGEEVTTECLICYDEIKLHKRICCSFAACDSCIVQYITTKVNEGVVKIHCISDGCDAYIYRDEIIGRLPVELKDKYYQFLVDANKDPKVKTCPRCSNIRHLTKEDTSQQTKYGLLVHCSECRLHWCFECQAPWHMGIKCKDFKKGDALLKQWAKETHFGEINAQKCPKCKIFIERRGGCDHMVCSKCDTSFCYKCGGRFLDLKYLGNHLSRFSPVGCKHNFYPNRPVLRRLIRGSALGAKLFGGVLLLGVGIAAVGVLCGASVIIVPAFIGYKYHSHRKRRRFLKRRQSHRAKLDSTIMELQRSIEARNADPSEDQDELVRDVYERSKLYSLQRGGLKPWDWEEGGAFSFEEFKKDQEPIHIGIQTGQSQQVDVTVHNPYKTDPTLTTEGNSRDAEIRMNITDEHGQVAVTTAEISHNAKGADGSEAEIVLHVRTSYPKPLKSSKEVSVTTSETSELNESSKTDTEGKSLTDVVDTIPKSGSVCDNKPNSSQIHRRVHSTGSLKKMAKKQEFGSISRKWRLKSTGAKPSQDEGDSPDLDQSQTRSLSTQSEDNKHLSDTDQNMDNENLTQSGCFISLFGKKLNTLQNHIEKEKILSMKTDSHSTVEKITCPDTVSCSVDKPTDNDKNDEHTSSDGTVEKDSYLGLVATENSTTAL